ncbi:MAG: cytochrome c-552 like protein [Gammaproteobacteria bacterium]|jgi:hypothetical protein|nr:cytochrome c-552 like protein [Gammaproteobacteria bacterium]
MYKRALFQSLRQRFRNSMLTAVSSSGLVVLTVMLVLALRSAWAEDVDSSISTKELFETHCSTYHSLELPRSQRLDRKTWRWVVDDMVNEFGATWITEKQQVAIIDYRVKNYGPNRARD